MTHFIGLQRDLNRKRLLSQTHSSCRRLPLLSAQISSFSSSSFVLSEIAQGLDYLQSRSGHPAGGYGGGYGYEDPTSLLPVRKLQESESGTSEKLFLYILIYLFI